MINAILTRFANGHNVTPADVNELFDAVKTARALEADRKAKTVPTFTVEPRSKSEPAGVAPSKSVTARLEAQTGDVFAALPLGVRATLRNNGIYTVNDLAKCSRKYLLHIGISDVKQQACADFLRARGFTLKDK